MATQACGHKQPFTGLVCNLPRWHAYEHRYPEPPSNG